MLSWVKTYHVEHINNQVTICIFTKVFVIWQVYLVDYGLAYRYMVDSTHKPYKEDPKRAHDGTAEYASRDAHKGVCMFLDFHSQNVLRSSVTLRHFLRCHTSSFPFWNNGFLTFLVSDGIFFFLGKFHVWHVINLSNRDSLCTSDFLYLASDQNGGLDRSLGKKSENLFWKLSIKIIRPS